ncbi:hypothetical protein K1719_033301 [Acacia pycnantha]|nr:hypothetical protein K1719_033301 [Acacia pycnantha]
MQSHQNGFSLELTAALLAKDKFNAFGLMQPFSEDSDRRSVRAYGIYPYASFFNHDCLPNACRFDYVDTSSTDDNHNTDITIRMIHDVPEGRECDRCNVEANWSDNESVEDDGAEDIEEAMDEDECENMAASDTEKLLGYFSSFTPQGKTPSNVMECNVCSNLKSDNVLDGDGGQDGVSMED